MDDIAFRREAVRTLAAKLQEDVQVVVAAGLKCIPWACWLGEARALPVAYVREAAPKAYGRQRQLEGGQTAQAIVLLLAEDTGHADAVKGLLGAARVDIITLSDVFA